MKVVKDRVRDRLERPKRTSAAVKRHVTKVAYKLVTDFGIDQYVVPLPLSPAFLGVQADLQ
jgi:hypothetical protein